MKKKSIIIIIILGLALIGGYFVFDSIFPKAEPISGPTQNRANKDRLIKSISLMKNDNSRYIRMWMCAFHTDKHVKYIF